MTPVSEVVKSKRVPLITAPDVVMIRQAVRALTLEIGLSLVDQTKIITAASEIARNTVIYGGGGEAILEVVRSEAGRDGLRLAFEDQGPGIPDIDRAFTDGFTSGSGLGLGLGGAKRLASEFYIESAVGVGTKITIVKWK